VLLGESKNSNADEFIAAASVPVPEYPLILEPAVSPIAISVESLSNLKKVAFVGKATEAILIEPVTRILLEVELGVIVTDNPVTSENVIEVVVKVSVLVVEATCKIAELPKPTQEVPL
jgi:hypothetical protein